MAVDVTGVNLTNRGVRVMLADDPAVYQRQDDVYDWDEVTATGRFSWRWFPCCTDVRV